jgi:cyclase
MKICRNPTGYTRASPTFLPAFLYALLLVAPLAKPVFAADPQAIEISQLTDSLYYLKGHGGNIVVSTGKDGVFMVDDQYSTQSGPIQDALKSLSLPAPKFLINTHWHNDHAGSNQHFEAGGAVILAHENVRKRLSTDQFIEFFKADMPAAPDAALPVITFEHRMNLHLNDEDIEIRHAPNAHTDGDAIIYFRKNNVLHMGDVFFEDMYPFIDTSSGGTVGGVIAAIEAVLPMINDNTQVVPGHGPVSDKEGLTAFKNMLKKIQKSIAEQIIAGRTEQQVIALKPTKAFDSKYASGFLKPDNFVRLIYQNIAHTTLR